MAFVTAAVAALLVAAVSGGRVPPIPAGHRAEYNLLHPDGSFRYGFDTGSGQTARVEGDARNEVRGGYSYGSPGGTVGVQYTAGVGGFVPSTGDLQLPLGPGNAASGGAVGWKGNGIKTSWSSGSSGGGVWGVAPSVPVTSGVQGPIGPIRPDGSYSFSYSTGDQSRQESGDASNNVRGSFSYRAKDDGKTRTVNYHAGANTGFIAQGAHLPTPPTPLGAPLGGPWTATTYDMGQGDSQVNIGHAEGHWSDNESATGPSGDASYQFGYKTQDASRQEASDAQGNIRGSYSYVSGDGQSRRIDYEAGAGKGFVATGDIVPQGGSASSSGHAAAGGIQSAWESGAGVHPTWQDGTEVQQTIQPSWQEDAGVQRTMHPSWQGEAGVQQVEQPSWQSGSGVQRSGVPANTQVSQHGDGSYSFSYSTPDQSRQEAADARGNVQGSFSFVAKDDGQTRRVDYHAGAGTGFVAKGDHLPKPQPSGVQQSSIELDDRVSFEDDSTQQTLLRSGDDDTGMGKEGSGDASYQFSYQNKDSSRQEMADAKGNVQGSFSFVAPDGVNRRVDYEAGAGKGFVARGDHLPKEGVVAAGQPDEQQTQGPWDVQTTLSGDEQATQVAWSGDEGSGDGAMSSKDGSYSYAYETGSSRKQETADSAGNVQGSYSYIDASGKTKTVTYTARDGEGFRAHGDHLPKPGQFLLGVGDVHGGSMNTWGRGGITPRLGEKMHWSSGAAGQQTLLPEPVAKGKSVLEMPVGDGVLRTYLPPHGIKAGYVFESKSG